MSVESSATQPANFCEINENCSTLGCNSCLKLKHQSCLEGKPFAANPLVHWSAYKLILCFSCKIWKVIGNYQSHQCSGAKHAVIVDQVMYLNCIQVQILSKSGYLSLLLTPLSIYTALISSEQAWSVFNTFWSLWSISAQRHPLRVLWVHGSCGLMTFTQLVWKRSGRAFNFQLGSHHCLATSSHPPRFTLTSAFRPPVWIIGSCFRADEKLHKPCFSLSTNRCMARYTRNLSH